MLDLKHLYRQVVVADGRGLELICSINITENISLVIKYEDFPPNLNKGNGFYRKQANIIRFHNTVNEREDLHKIVYKFTVLEQVIGMFLTDSDTRLKNDYFLNKDNENSSVRIINRSQDPDKYLVLEDCENSLYLYKNNKYVRAFLNSVQQELDKFVTEVLKTYKQTTGFSRELEKTIAEAIAVVK